jgi:DNA-binding transcriptional regulator YhcF (GntR family)
MAEPVSVTDQLRRRLVSDLHIGRLRSGDSLPSIREVARSLGADHRVVARAYRELEAEGLVEVRAKSGVVVAGGGTSSQAHHDLLQWLGGVLAEAWTRRVPLRGLAPLVARATAGGLRCLVIESTEDHEVALAAELAEDFGLDVSAHRVGTAAGDAALDAALATCDFAVTTSFHAPSVAPLAAARSVPLVVASVHPVLRECVAALLREGNVTVVIADALYAARARDYMYGFAEGRDYRFVRVENAGPLAAIESDRCLFTRAARRRLGLPEYHLLPRTAPFISPTTAQDIARVMVRLAIGP